MGEERRRLFLGVALLVVKKIVELLDVNVNFRVM